MIEKIITGIVILFLGYKLITKTKIIDKLKINIQETRKNMKENREYKREMNDLFRHQKKMFKIDDEI
jgi:hypothetical protein